MDGDQKKAEVEMSYKISLYIPCYNVGKYIGFVVDAVLKQTLKSFEIIVVDDGSTDNTLEIVRKYPEIKIIQHERNKGLAAARNTAIKNAKGDFIASLDADCVASPDWLEKLVANMDDPKIAIAGGILHETVLKTSADKWRHIHMVQAWGDKKIVNPPFMFGNNNIIRRAALDAECVYDERLRTNGEDADITRQIRAKGFDTVYDPSAVVSHMREDTITSILKSSWRYHYSAPKSLIYDKSFYNCIVFFYYMIKGDGIRLIKDVFKLRLSIIHIDICIIFYKFYNLLKVMTER